MSSQPPPLETQSSAPPSALLTFANVSKWSGQVSALMDISFAVRGEVVGLVGRNGAGKSTLMKLASGLLRPSEGQVLVCGDDASTARARAQLGFCPDLDRLYERQTGREFVAWMLRLHGASAAAARQRAGDVLQELGLGEHMHRRVCEYSKGMRQRVRLAQALAHSPKILLLDEPMTGLDPIARHELAQQIMTLARNGIGVLISSHVLHELEAMVNRVLLIHQGRLLAEGRVAELRGQLRGQPHRLRLISECPRDLAAALVPLSQVVGMQLSPNAVEVSLSGEPGFYGALTKIAAARDLVSEAVPLDDSLASVFGYLVG